MLLDVDEPSFFLLVLWVQLGGSVSSFLARSWPASLQTTPPFPPLSCPHACLNDRVQWPVHVFPGLSGLEGGDSSSSILFRPNPAFWKCQWLFISFPKLLRDSHTPRSCFISSHCVSQFLVLSSGCYSCFHLQGITNTLICTCKVAISRS